MALLFSTDTDLDAMTILRYYKARFQIELEAESSFLMTFGSRFYKDCLSVSFRNPQAIVDPHRHRLRWL